MRRRLQAVIPFHVSMFAGGVSLSPANQGQNASRSEHLHQPECRLHRGLEGLIEGLRQAEVCMVPNY